MSAFLDSNDLPSGHVLDADVCIVGAGAAGITLARALMGSGMSVLLLEGGGLEVDPRSQRLLVGRGHLMPYSALDTTRLRCFGGTTQHWTGWCRPLEAMDFDVRPEFAHSGWPFPRSEIEPYYVEAQALCGLGALDYSPAGWAERTRTELLPITGSAVQTCLWQFSRPVRFGTEHANELQAAPDVTVCLNANVVDIETDDAGRRVSRLTIARFDRDPVFAKGRTVIVAAGGIENARLLLASDTNQRTGLGNKNDLVGRYFMEHPHVLIGKVLCAVPRKALRLYENVVDVPGGRPAAVRAGFAVTDELRRAEGLCGFSATLEPAAALSDARIADGVEESLGAIYEERTTSFDLFARTEQAPNPNSRIKLDWERDELGMRRSALEWDIDQVTRRSIVRGVELLAEAFGRSGIGRIMSYAHTTERTPQGTWPIIGGGYHHMGTTRMHLDPAHGVVDDNCRVHGMDNLYVAGSSVFPTGGYGNPTLTLVALALRLAVHLREKTSI